MRAWAYTTVKNAESATMEKSCLAACMVSQSETSEADRLLEESGGDLGKQNLPHFIATKPTKMGKMASRNE